jgi:hypothetical protein
MNPLFNFLQHLSVEGVRVLPLRPRGKEAILKDWVNKAFNSSELVDQYFKDTLNNAGIVTGKVNNIIVIDIDPKNGGFESFAKLEEEVGPIKDLCFYIVLTGSGGLHLYFYHPDNLCIKGRINFRAGIDIKSDGGYVVSPYSIHPNGTQYLPLIEHDDKSLYVDQLTPLPENLLKLLTTTISPDVAMSPHGLKKHVTEGSRNHTLFKIGSAIRNHLISDEAVRTALLSENKLRCHPTLPDSEVNRISESVLKYEPKLILEPMISEECFYGIAGTLANESAPEVGVSREAVLFQFLIFIGNMCEHKFYFNLGGSKLYLNDYLLIVGETSKAKKGTSLKTVKYFIEKINSDYYKLCIRTGVNSGEGLVNSVRDKVISKEKNKKGEEVETILDEGGKSKIALFIEPEFSRLMKSGKRDGNTATEILRQAWDGDYLEVVVKKDSCSSSDHHISMIGHITQNEFEFLNSNVDSTNGYLNRFLFCRIFNGSPVPLPISFDKLSFDFMPELHSAMAFIKNTEIEELALEEDAKELWTDIYNNFFYSPDDNYSDLMARTPTHILKMAMIFAVLDRNNRISKDHLISAKAIVDYSNDSIRFIFTNPNKKKLGNENKVIEYITKKNGTVLRSDVMRELFNRKIKALDLDFLKDSLTNQGLIKVQQLDGSERWSLPS